MDANEKRDKTILSNWFINGFCHAMIDFGLSHVSIEGYMFMWYNSLGAPHAVEERLVRV